MENKPSQVVYIRHNAKTGKCIGYSAFGTPIREITYEHTEPMEIKQDDLIISFGSRTGVPSNYYISSLESLASDTIKYSSIPNTKLVYRDMDGRLQHIAIN